MGESKEEKRYAGVLFSVLNIELNAGSSQDRIVDLQYRPHL